MSVVAWILLGGVLAFLALSAYVGWRIDQSARSLASLAEIVGRVGRPKA